MRAYSSPTNCSATQPTLAEDRRPGAGVLRANRRQGIGEDHVERLDDAAPGQQACHPLGRARVGAEIHRLPVRLDAVDDVEDDLPGEDVGEPGEQLTDRAEGYGQDDGIGPGRDVGVRVGGESFRKTLPRGCIGCARANADGVGGRM